MGRPSLPPEQRREHRLRLYVALPLLRRIRAAAEREGVRVSEWLRRLAERATDDRG